ncbi:efflux RND transporter periplasmic adaptor subunit [Halothiobacillus sp. DCM-1]|uniref:efflux RND transporter periplasmic adaptor subunit n=1 Tax=Halothiobacillus sp. DCM-1 TaxID=3112558 RepID=UPI003254FEBB
MIAVIRLCAPRVNRSLGRTLGLTLGMSLALLPQIGTAETLQGELAWSGLSRLSLPVSGVIQSIPVVPGQTVAEGTVLLRLDSTPFTARLAAVRAQQAGLTRAAAEAKRDAERAQQLYDRTVASDSEVQTALIAEEKAAAELAKTKAQIQLKQWELTQSNLKAPYAARILGVEVAPGETISADLTPTPLMTIARADQIDATVRVQPAIAAGLSLGQTLRVSVGNEHKEGKLSAISVSSEQRPPYLLRITLPAQPGWIAGLPAEITLP